MAAFKQTAPIVSRHCQNLCATLPCRAFWDVQLTPQTKRSWAQTITGALTWIDNARPARWLVLFAGVALMGASAAWVIKQIIAHPEWPAGVDMGLYLRAADAVSHGTSLYAGDAGEFHRYPYPPLFADVLALLTALLGDQLAAFVWMGAGGVFLVAALFLIMRRFGFSTPVHWIALIAGALLVGRSGRAEIYHGQVNFALLLLLVAGLMCWRSGRARLASVLWAAMICFKPFLGVVVLFLLRRGDWRTAAMTFVLSGVIFALSFLPMHADLIGAFLGWRETTQHYAAPAYAANPLNQSFYGLLLRLFTDNAFSRAWADLPFLVPLGLAALAIIAAMAFLALAQKDELSKEESPTRDLICLSAALAAIMSLGPVTEGNHLYFFLPAAIGVGVLGLRRWRENAPRRGLWAAAAAAWGLLMLGPLWPKLTPLHFASPESWNLLEGFGILLSGHGGILLLTAAACTAATLQCERRDHAAGRAGAGAAGLR